MGKHDIGWAVDCLNMGISVRRPHWAKGMYVFMHYRVVQAPDGSEHNVHHIYIHMPEQKRLQLFTCHQDDLLATDWESA